MKKVDIQAMTKEYGCVVYASITLPEDYTMNMVVNEVRRLGFSAFRLINTMKKFVYVQIKPSTSRRAAAKLPTSGKEKKHEN